MGKTKFVFDKESGTLKPSDEVKVEEIQMTEQSTTTSDSTPTDEVSLDLSSRKPNVDMNENIIQFRESSDYTIFQVVDDKSRKPMMIIAGYGLEIKFNMAELRSTEKIEQLLGGLTSMFRKMILEQALKKG